MKIITFKDVAALKIAPAMCFDWVENTIKNKRQALLPPKISMKPFDGTFCNVMPSIILGVDGKSSFGGVKLVTRYPNRVPSLKSCILLMNANTGEFLALMDGTWITAMRTGAVAAHSVMLFAKKDFSVLGMMGLGNTARAALLVLCEKCDKKLTIKLLKYKGQEEEFAARFSHYKNLRFVYVDTVEEMVRGSDVVISGATYLPEDVCTDECFSEGVLVVPIHTLGFTNCDLLFDKVFADDVGHVRHFKNFDKFKCFAEVCDVVNGLKSGREDDAERILIYNIGISVHDIHFAASIYEMMEQKGILTSLPEADLKIPTEKFWV